MRFLLTSRGEIFMASKTEGRINLSVKPATAKGIRQLAYLSGGSLNEYIGKILDDIVTRNSETLQKFETAETAARQELKAE